MCRWTLLILDPDQQRIPIDLIVLVLRQPGWCYAIHSMVGHFGIARFENRLRSICNLQPAENIGDMVAPP
jgi:hypothetical protein